MFSSDGAGPIEVRGSNPALAGLNAAVIFDSTNPTGEDFLRYEPRLYASQNVSVRHRVKEWLDHLLFVGYDIFAKNGKATGSGTRTIYPVEMPTHWAKSRKLRDPIPFQSETDSNLWQRLFAA